MLRLGGIGWKLYDIGVMRMMNFQANRMTVQSQIFQYILTNHTLGATRESSGVTASYISFLYCIGDTQATNIL